MSLAAKLERQMMLKSLLRAGTRPAGAGPWVSHPGVSNLRVGGAPVQSLEGSCLSSCGEILTDGVVSEGEFLAEIGEWATPEWLSDALNARAGAARWQGGYFGSSKDALRATRRGRGATVLWDPKVGRHAVVVEPLPSGRILVRDPSFGGTYEVTLDWIEEFAIGGVWRR